jgi:EAL domain-containing protein (putative c-di-GMP-specific phosphodiesterase class I)
MRIRSTRLHPADLNDDSLFAPDAPLSRHAHRVVLEITERQSLDNISEVRSRFAALRKLGYRLAIDDLGAGYAGLSSVATLNPEVIKIDMSLVRGIDASFTRQVLVRSLVGLGQSIGAEVVAEGIETEAERDVLVDLECRLLQGYLFGRPAKTRQPLSAKMPVTP